MDCASIDCLELINKLEGPKENDNFDILTSQKVKFWVQWASLYFKGCGYGTLFLLTVCGYPVPPPTRPPAERV